MRVVAVLLHLVLSLVAGEALALDSFSTAWSRCQNNASSFNPPRNCVGGEKCWYSTAIGSVQQTDTQGRVGCDFASGFWPYYSVPTCSGGQVWDVYATACQCPAGQIVVNGQCQVPATCTAPAVLDAASNSCVCPAGYEMMEGACVVAPPQCTAGEPGGYGYLAKAPGGPLSVRVGQNCGFDSSGCEACGDSANEECYEINGAVWCYGQGKKTGQVADSQNPGGGDYVPPSQPAPGGSPSNFCTQIPTYPGCNVPTSGDGPNPLNGGSPVNATPRTGDGLQGGGAPGASSPGGSVGTSPPSGGATPTGSSGGTPGGTKLDEAGTPISADFGAGAGLQDAVFSEFTTAIAKATSLDQLPLFFDFQLPATSCRPFVLGVLDQTKEIDVCPLLEKVRMLLGWLLAAFCMHYLWKSAINAHKA